MSEHILKFPLPSTPGPFAIEAPRRARFISVQTQPQGPVVYLACDKNEPTKAWPFRVEWTGGMVPAGHAFLATYTDPTGLVCHLFVEEP